MHSRAAEASFIDISLSCLAVLKVCRKPGSVLFAVITGTTLPPRATIIYLGRTLLNGSSNQPGRASGKGCFLKKLRPIRSCSRWGLPGTKSPAFLGVSYTSVPSLPVHALRRPSAVHFCGTILQLALTGRYPAPCPVEPGLSSRGFKAAGDCLSNFHRQHYIVYRH